MADLHHECAVTALYDLEAASGSSKRQVFKQTVRMLMDLQTRGQLSAGITTYSPKRDELLKTYKGVGSVDHVFGLSREGVIEGLESEFDGVAAIGHSRYATTGEDDIRYAQPFERRHGRPWKWFGFAFNGTLANYTELRERLASTKGYHFALDTDTEVIEHYLAYALRGEEEIDLASVMRTLSEVFDGAYCITFIDGAGRMMVARDPLGLRPLSWGLNDGIFAAASESVALMNLGFRDIQAVAPGEVVLVEKGLVRTERYAETRQPAHCFFEWVYFANAVSNIDSLGVYESRARAGETLARRETVAIDDDTIAVPVPDTAKAAADAFAYHLRIPCVEGIFRNRYVGRTFIQGASARAEAIRNKYTPLPSVLRGKRVFLIEDSIVRSATLRSLVASITEKCVPREIHVRVACPPIMAPCFYGIDMSTVGELFAPQHLPAAQIETIGAKTESLMAVDLGVDSLRYLTMAETAAAIGIDQSSLCVGCVTGQYPTNAGNALYETAKSVSNKGEGRVFRPART